MKTSNNLEENGPTAKPERQIIRDIWQPLYNLGYKGVEQVDAQYMAMLIAVAVDETQAYISNKEREARIDELDRLKFTIDNTRKSMDKPLDMTSDMAIQVRLLELKQEDNGGSGV